MYSLRAALSLTTASILAAVSASDVGYITELELYSQLAQCATSAIYAGFADVSYTASCEDDVTSLQSCMCNGGNLRTMRQVMASSVSSACGTTGTDDQFSMSRVLDQYCDPSTTIAFATPTANEVSLYIMEVPEISLLAPCARTAIGDPLGRVSARCPSAANLWAPCACSKTGVYSAFLESATRFARSACSNAQDASYVKSFIGAYCDMNQGTTSFGKPAGPSGDMSYYITALPQFKSLNSCAQSGLSEAVYTVTDYLCAAGPQAMAYCACMKSGVANGISSRITSGVKYECTSAVTDDLAAALKVYDYYCDAAQKKVVANIAETATDASISGLPTQTGSRPNGPAETGDSGNPQDDRKFDETGRTSAKIKPGVIAGIVVGVVVGIAVVIAALVFFVIRKRRNNRAANEANGQEHNSSPDAPANGNELDGANAKGELPGASYSPSSELDAKSPATTVASPNAASEVSGLVPGHAVSYYNNSPVHEAPGGQPPQTWQGQGQGEAYELDSQNTYHAR